MKKIFLLICLGLFMVSTITFAEEDETEDTQDSSSQADLKLDAEAVILMDATSGAVLYQKNALLSLEPASVTKVMTIYLAITHGNLDATVTVSKEAVDSIDRSSSHIALDYDEEVRVEDMCYAAALSSANDAANVLAEHVSGSQEEFVKLMNETAQSMGAKNTMFYNAHGLPTNEDKTNVTTAYDLAIMMKTIMKNDTYMKISQTTSWTAQPTNKLSEPRVFGNGNEMIKKSELHYDYATSGKTGWTEDAGYTYVATASKDNMNLIVVILNAKTKDDRYKDALTLFNYGFDNYKQVLIKASDIEAKEVQVLNGKKVVADVKFDFEHDFNVLLAKDTDESSITMDIEVRNENDPDQINAYLNLYLHGVKIAEVLMEKEMQVYDLSFSATTLPLIMNVLDGISVVVMLFFMSLIGISFFSTKNKKRKKRLA